MSALAEQSCMPSAKKRKPTPQWYQMEIIACQIIGWFVDTIFHSYHYDAIPFKVFVESGAISSYSEARQDRIRRSGKIPGDQYGIDGIVVYKPVNDITRYGFTQVKDYTHDVNSQHLATFIHAITKAKKLSKLDKSYLLTTSATAVGSVHDMGETFDFDVINMSEAQLLLTKTDMATAETAATSSIADLVPRDYQLAAVDTVMKAFSNTVSHTNSVIGLPPGTGKTFIMCLAMRELFKRGVRYGIIACPNRSSTTQMYETVASFFGEAITSTLISMDGSTAFELELEPPAKPHVYVSTFKSMEIVVDQVHGGMTRQNTVVFYDEAHHQEVMNFDQYLYHWSFLTVLVSGMWQYIHEDLLRYIDPEYRFTMLLTEAEEKGYVVPQQHWFPSYVDTTPFAQVEDAGSQPELFAKFAASVFTISGCRRVLLYWNTVAGAKQVREHIQRELCDDLCYKAEFRLITLYTPDPERQKIFRWFAEGPDTEFRGIVSIHTLNESLNIPRVNGVAISSVGNAATMLQRTCRANRLYRGKTHCTIAFFCTPEEVVRACPESYINRTHTIYCTNTNIAAAARSKDDASTRAAREMAASIVRDSINSPGVVSLVLWGWYQWVNSLAEFIGRYGFKALDYGSTYNGRQLGEWYSTQTTKWLKDELTDREIQELVDAGAEDLVYEPQCVIDADAEPTVVLKCASVESVEWPPYLDSFAEKVRIIKNAVDAGVTFTRYNVVYNGHNVGQWCQYIWRKRKALTPDEKSALDTFPFEWIMFRYRFGEYAILYKEAKANGTLKPDTEEHRFAEYVKNEMPYGCHLALE